MRPVSRLILVLLAGLALRQAVPAQAIDVYSRPIRHEPSRTYDALHYRVALTFDLEQKRFCGFSGSQRILAW